MEPGGVISISSVRSGRCCADAAIAKIRAIMADRIACLLVGMFIFTLQRRNHFVTPLLISLLISYVGLTSLGEEIRPLIDRETLFRGIRPQPPRAV